MRDSCGLAHHPGGVSTGSDPQKCPPEAASRLTCLHPLFFRALEREVGATEVGCPSQLPSRKTAPSAHREPELRPPEPGRSQESWAGGIILALHARRLDLFPEEETEGQSDPHACDDQSLCV